MFNHIQIEKLGDQNFIFFFMGLGILQLQAPFFFPEFSENNEYSDVSGGMNYCDSDLRLLNNTHFQMLALYEVQGMLTI